MNSVSYLTDNMISAVNAGASLTMLKDAMNTQDLQWMKPMQTIQDANLGQNVDTYA